MLEKLKRIKWLKCLSWLPNASMLIFFWCFVLENVVWSWAHFSQSQSKGSRPLDIWSVLMEDFTAHWALMSWSVLIREQLSGTLTSCPINRPGRCARMCTMWLWVHISVTSQTKKKSWIKEFPRFGDFRLCTIFLEKHHNCACCYSSALYYVSPVGAETSSIKQCLRSDSMAPQWANCTLMKLIKSQTGAAFSIAAVIPR